jgi:hypothetical protein
VEGGAWPDRGVPAVRTPGPLAELQGEGESEAAGGAQGRRRMPGGAKCGARSMRRMCEALETRTRQLVAWPATADDTNVWLRPEEAMRAIIRRIQET